MQKQDSQPLAESSQPEPATARLLQCLYPPDPAQQRAAITSVTDWQPVLAAAGRHGLLPSLFNAVRAFGWPVPPELRARLEQWHKRHIGTAMAQLAALDSITCLFRGEELRAVAWKGPTLALALYGSTLARESTDLDFLVAPEDLSRATGLLSSLGFAKHRKTRTERNDRRVAAADRDLGFVRRSDGVFVELHTETMPARFHAWQHGSAYMERAVLMNMSSGITIEVLCPEDLLLSLVSHGIKHHWEHLKWVEDTARFLELHHESLDWPALLRRTRREGKSRALVHGAALAAQMMQAPLHESLRQSPELLAVAALTDTKAAALLSDQSGADEAEKAGLMNLLIPSCLGRWRFAARRALEPQLRDYNDGFSRSALLCKWRRLFRHDGVRGLVLRASASLGRTR